MMRLTSGHAAVRKVQVPTRSNRTKSNRIKWHCLCVCRVTINLVLTNQQRHHTHGIRHPTACSGQHFRLVQYWGRGYQSCLGVQNHCSKGNREGVGMFCTANMAMHTVTRYVGTRIACPANGPLLHFACQDMCPSACVRVCVCACLLFQSISR